jgi:hypothetical protein
MEPDQIDVRDCGNQETGTKKKRLGEKRISGLTNPVPSSYGSHV